MKDLILTIDVGTGSTRAGVVDLAGEILDFKQQEYDQITPHTGWSEQKPSQWWNAARESITYLLHKHPEWCERICVVSCCGQMHGTVLLDDNDELVVDSAILWNDKRPAEIVEQFIASNDVTALATIVNNPPTTAWPAFKIAWLQKHQPDVWEKVAHVLMPKDYINLRLTGKYATDLSEASCFYLMDCNTQQYSPQMLALFNIKPQILPKIMHSTDIMGYVSKTVAEELGIEAGTPVVAGIADMAATLLGSGVSQIGDASDSTGTSTLLTVVSKEPNHNPLLNNLHLAGDNWGTFALLDAGGDAMRWTRLALDNNSISYAKMIEQAKLSPVCSHGLLFLPYLTGERNAQQKNSRAQFFGLTRKHRKPELIRSVLEGVAYASNQNLVSLQDNKAPIRRMIASGGGAKDPFWLKIKASTYHIPIVKTASDENGVLGCAIIGGVGIGRFKDIQHGVDALVKFDYKVEPKPSWEKLYQQGQAIFDRLYQQSTSLYDDLDALEQNATGIE